MRVPFEPLPRDPRADAHLGEISPALFDDALYLSCELVDRYALDWAYDLARRLRVDEALAATGSAAEVVERIGAVPRLLPAIEWLLDRLAADGVLAVEDGVGGTARFRLARPLREGETAALRAVGVGIEPGVARTLDLLDAAAAAWPAVASGEGTGEHELFATGHIPLWIAYFHNANRVYAINNRMAAAAAANRLREGGGLRLLEVGAGAGSAAEALLEELAARGRLGDIERYDVTEPSPFFRRRAERELKARFPGAPLRFAAADVDRPLAPQGLGGAYDLVLGVNVLHVAKNLRAALGHLVAALAPGGWLVAGECLRLFPGQPVAADLVFQLFDSFVAVETDPEIRPRHGFLEPATWRRAFAAAGLADVAVVPDLERIRDFYPRFSSGAVVGRRPST